MFKRDGQTYLIDLFKFLIVNCVFLEYGTVPLKRLFAHKIILGVSNAALTLELGDFSRLRFCYGRRLAEDIWNFRDPALLDVANVEATANILGAILG